MEVDHKREWLILASSFLDSRFRHMLRRYLCNKYLAEYEMEMIKQMINAVGPPPRDLVEDPKPFFPPGKLSEKGV